MRATTSPTLILRRHIIGALLTVQTHKGKKERNDRLVAIPSHSHLERSLTGALDLEPSHCTARPLSSLIEKTMRRNRPTFVGDYASYCRPRGGEGGPQPGT